MLNTIVASELCEIADKMESVSKENFKDALKDLLAEIVRDHKRVIFNGDGYSDEWVVEAEKRGLPNFRTTVDCVPHYLEEKNVNLFEKFGIFTKAEVEARVEILMESYAKTINIEALTMIDMAKKKYIPVCLSYSKELADAIAVKKSIGVCAAVETEIVEKVSKLTKDAYEATAKLEEVTAVAAANTDMSKMAVAYKDTVLPVMDELRKAVDSLEVIVPSSLWPVPAYSDMIFNV
jgi:glutamine synthetase